MHLKYFLASLLFVPAIIAQAQQTAVLTEVHEDYIRGVQYFDEGLFGQAYLAFDELLHESVPANEPDYDLLNTRSQLYRVKSAIRMNMPEAELMALNFIQSNKPDPVATEATVEIADYYFNSGQYDKAITYYAMLEARDLNQVQFSEVRFKHGYSYFVRKEFEEAEEIFAEVRELKNVYYYPSNYYYGMCRFFVGDYGEAISAFERVGGSEKYKAYVPYYITQIYFSQGDYDKVIAYGVPKLDQRVESVKLIHHLVGQAYFENGEYAAALPHLEYYEQHSGQMRAEDFFQLGYVQYDRGQYDKASANFLNIANAATNFGQRANFYLADCYLKAGDTRGARNAFRAVSRMTYDTDLQEEALFNYGKLSAELDYDFDAIQALDAITADSKYYAESQELLRDVFADTRDYASALKTLNSLTSLSPTLKEAHQRLSLLRGLQLLTDGDTESAVEQFKAAQKHPVNPSHTAQSLFWQAEIAYSKDNYQASTDLYHQYFTLTRNGLDLPAESSVSIANYNQGYNYLKQENFVTAEGHFQTAVAGLRQDRLLYQDPYYLTQVMPDGLSRAGDCLFKRNRYQAALRFYQEAIDLEKYGHVYARFQKAIIQGLINQPFEKIIQLEEIVRLYPTSQFADDALFHTAITYQEMGNAEKSLKALQTIIADHGSSEYRNPANLRLGLISYNNGDLTASIDYYKSVFQSNPTATEAQEALSALEEIYVQDLANPNDYFAFVESIPGYQVSDLKKDSVSFRTAEVRYENTDYANAIVSFSEYLQQFPGGANVLSAHYYRGESHAILKQFDQAVYDYGNVIDRGASAFYQKSLKKAATISYHHQQDFDSAYRYYQLWTTETTDPSEQHEASVGLMRSAYRTGRLAEAQAAAQIVADFPNITSDVLAEAAYYQGKSEYDRKNYDLALTQLNIVTRKSDNALTAEARYLIAHIYYLRRQLDIAEKLCHNANRESSNYPYWVAKCLLLLSDIYVDQNDLFNARAPLEALIENFTGEREILDEARQRLQAIDALQVQQSRIKSNVSDTLELDTTNRGNYER